MKNIIKVLSLALALILTVAAVSGCKDNAKNTETNSANNATEAENGVTEVIDTKDETTAASEEQESETEAADTGSGNEIRVGDTLNGKKMRITYLESGEYKDDSVLTQPEEGKKYIFIKLFCENVSSSSQSVTFANFDCYADGYACDLNILANGTLSTSLTPGRVTEGIICFEVPQDASVIEIEYKENLLLSAEYKFIYEGIKSSGITVSKEAVPTEGAHKTGEVVEGESCKVTYLSCGEVESDGIFMNPDEGHKIIKFEFEVENTSSNDLSVTTANFKCYADNASCDANYFVGDMLSATLSSGRKVKGNVCFEVPVDASVIEVEYQPSILSDEIIIFSYDK